MRRRALVFLSATIAALGVWTACSDYDDATLIPDNDAATTSSSSGSDAAVAADAGQPVDASDDVIEVLRDDASVVDAASCMDTCDCDGDKFLKAGCVDGAAPGGDCDDLDPFRHPGQTQYVKDKTANGDWNCDKVVEKSVREDFTCSGSGITGCSSIKGFDKPVACGEIGDFYECVVAALNCTKKLVEPRTQACR